MIKRIKKRPYKKYSLEQAIDAVKTSISKREVLIKLSLVPRGGNYQTIDKLIEEHNLDISHFKGRSSNSGKSFGPKRPITDYLENKVSITSHTLKLRMIEEGFFERKCSCCSRTEWLDQPIPLHLDHINGDHDNNNLSNLRLLCPNCHALTPTYGNKNIKRKK